MAGFNQQSYISEDGNYKFTPTNWSVDNHGYGSVIKGEGFICPTYNKPLVKGSVVKKVIFNAPATIVYWSDGTKTVVKCSKNDVYDKEKGFALAVAKKFFGNKGNYKKEMKRWVNDES